MAVLVPAVEDAVLDDGPPLSNPCSPAAMSGGFPIKFNLPPECNTFPLFARLPAELRHQIWEGTLSTPGMHFLKVEQTEENPRSGQLWWSRQWGPDEALPSSMSDDPSEFSEEVKREKPLKQTAHALLKPLYPTPMADISYYTTLSKQLAKLSVTCAESASVAKRLAKGPEVLTLENGRIVSLNIHSDAIYLEYVPPDIFLSGCQFTKVLECAGLDQIRKVALRFHHKWFDQSSPRRCPHCGRVHERADGVAFPRHIYKFMAQYLPNVEQFYFIDYFILRRPFRTHVDADGNVIQNNKSSSTSSSCKFEGGNRKYYEANQDDWNITSKVFEMTKWVQDRFVQYAKTSKLSKHTNPENVKFGVLACEWGFKPSTESSQIPVSSAKKGRNKRASSEEHTTRRNRRFSNRNSPSPAPTAQSANLDDHNLTFVFRASGENHFDFTFSFSHR